MQLQTDHMRSCQLIFCLRRVHGAAESHRKPTIHPHPWPPSLYLSSAVSRSVIRGNSSTTKARVVFDASRRTPEGSYPNDAVMVRPLVQEDLRSNWLPFKGYYGSWGRYMGFLGLFRQSQGFRGYQKILGTFHRSPTGFQGSFRGSQMRVRGSQGIPGDSGVCQWRFKESQEVPGEFHGTA